jgi:hypothetical protein
MKLRSGPLDDIHQELEYVLRFDGGHLARVLLFLVNSHYRIHGALDLAVLRWQNRRHRNYRYPEPGSEPLNADAADIAEAWKEPKA